MGWFSGKQENGAAANGAAATAAPAVPPPPTTSPQPHRALPPPPVPAKQGAHSSQLSISLTAPTSSNGVAATSPISLSPALPAAPATTGTGNLMLTKQMSSLKLLSTPPSRNSSKQPSLDMTPPSANGSPTSPNTLNTTSQPVDSELDRMFETFMDAKLFKNEVKQHMRQSMSAAMKWKLLVAESQTHAQTAVKTVDNSPHHWAQVLHHACHGVATASVSGAATAAGTGLTAHQLGQLGVVLRGCDRSWLQSFIEEESAVADLILIISTPSPQQNVNLESLKCLRSLMNNELGLDAIMHTENAIDQLTSILLTGDDQQRIIVVDLLSVVCWLSEAGHHQVLQALSHGRFHRRFKVLIDILRLPQTTNDTLQLKTRVLTFINTFINAINELEPRVNIRREFIDCGLVQCIEKCRVVVDNSRGLQWDNVAQLNTQLDTYEQLMANDTREVSLQELDLSDVDECWQWLYQYTSRTSTAQGPIATHLLDVLHLLMTISYDDPSHSDLLWQNVKYIVSYAINERQDDGQMLSYTQLKEIMAERSQSTSDASTSAPTATNEQVEQYQLEIKQMQSKLQTYEEKINKSMAEQQTRELELKRQLEKLRTESELSLKQSSDRLQAMEKQLQDAQQRATTANSSIPSAPPAPMLGSGAPPAPIMSGSGVVTGNSAPPPPPMAPSMITSSSAPPAPPAPAFGNNVPAPPPMSFAVPAVPGLSVPQAPGAPAAPPMAPSFGVPAAPSAPPMAPSFGVPAAPSAPPMAPGMSSVPAPPPMAPGIPSAPGAPPMAPSAPGAPPAPGAPSAPGAPAFGAPPMAPAVPTLPKKANNKPAVALKAFHWAVVPSNDLAQEDEAACIWRQLDDSKVKVDVKALELLFAAVNAMKKAAPAATEVKADDSKKKPELVALIDPKKSYAVNIALARFRPMSLAAIRDALLAMDNALLDEDKLSALSKITPTSEDIEAVVDYDGPDTTLGQTEQFYRTIAKIPQVTQRIELFLFKCRYTAMIAELESQLTVCEAALSAIHKSTSLRTVCELTLAIGNLLNGGTTKGGAYGFKLDTLTKLKSTKAAAEAAGSGGTLLTYIVQHCQQHHPKINMVTEFDSLPAAARVDTQMLQTEIQKLVATLNRIKSSLVAVPQTAADQYHTVMQAFYDTAHTQSTALQKRYTALQTETTNTVKYYAEDPSQLKLDALYQLFDTFYNDWRTAEDYLKQRKEQQEREAKSAAEKAKKEKERLAAAAAASKNSNSSVQKPPAVEKPAANASLAPPPTPGAVVDGVLSTLSSTNAGDLMKTIQLRRKVAQSTIKPLPSPPGMMGSTMSPTNFNALTSSISARLKQNQTMKFHDNPLSPPRALAG